MAYANSRVICGILLSALALASCGPSPEALTRTSLRDRMKDCESHFKWAQGSAYSLEGCRASAIYELGPKAGYGTATRAVFEAEKKRLLVAQAVDRGTLTPYQGALDADNLSAQASAEISAYEATWSSIKAEERSARWAGVNQSLLGASAGVLSANRPPSVTTTTCSALTPGFASCTSTGF